MRSNHKILKLFANDLNFRFGVKRYLIQFPMVRSRPFAKVKISMFILGKEIGAYGRVRRYPGAE